MDGGCERHEHEPSAAQIVELVIIRIQKAQDGMPRVAAAGGFACSKAHVVVVTVAAAGTDGNAEIRKKCGLMRRQQQLYPAADVVLNCPMNLPLACNRSRRKRVDQPACSRQCEGHAARR